MKSTGKRPRNRAKATLFASLATTLLGTIPACPTGTQFRSAALPAIHSGVSQILGGFVDGVFAAIAVEPDNSSGTPTSP